ncbi:MAG: M35 family metallo-endopeptidase, partial [Limisphaerales bacterium]
DASTGQWLNHVAGDLASVSGPPPTLSPGEAFYLQSAAAASLEIPDPALRIRFYHQDHLGSSSALTDADGALVEETAFYPFGHPRNQYEPRQIHEPYQFTQKEHDGESGLHYFEARYLEAPEARFISVDRAYASPDRLPQDKYKAFVLRPQLLNLYSYALNSPVRFQDPTGLEVVKLNWLQTAQVAVAQAQAVAMLDYAIKNVEQNKNACAPGNPAEPFLEQWFGYNNGLANKEQVVANLSKIRNQLANLKPENFLYDSAPSGNTAGAFAYVYPDDPKKIYLTDAFFAMPNSGVDTKAGTLIHENSHPTAVLGTDDLAYGPHDAAALASEDRGKALRNADNYEYFNEGLAIDQQLRSQNAAKEAAKDFSDLQSGTCSK